MIPKALETLKEASGDNWQAVKGHLNWHLDWKRKLERSSLCEADQKTLFHSIVKEKLFSHQTVYKAAELPEEGIESRIKNVISTISKIDYESEIVCFVNDGYNTNLKSGNKKYPFLQ